MIKLDKEKIIKGLDSLPINIDLFDVIDSTNKHLSLQKLDTTAHLCLAEQQTMGRGRRGREWASPFGKNIYCSYRFAFNKKMGALSGLSLVVSLAITKTLNAFGIQTAQVKWPNDVIYQQKKLAGSLIELKQAGETCYAIIGIGLNVNMTQEHEPHIDQAWTSMKEITGEEIDRNEIVITLTHNLTTYLKRFNDNGLGAFMEEWSAQDFLKEKQIGLALNQGTIKGKVIGIDEQGQLQLELQDKQIKSFTSGEASVLKP